jgi:hypothetical protein
MFHPARPPVTWSSVFTRRARRNGGYSVVDNVGAMPILRVAWAMRGRRGDGSFFIAAIAYLRYASEDPP